VCGWLELGDVGPGASVADGIPALGDGAAGDGEREAVGASEGEVGGVGDDAAPIIKLAAGAVGSVSGRAGDRRIAASATETTTSTRTRPDATARGDRHCRLMLALRIQARSMTFVCPSDLEL
jgi:hypothetical protein